MTPVSNNEKNVPENDSDKQKVDGINVCIF